MSVLLCGALSVGTETACRKAMKACEPPAPEIHGKCWPGEPAGLSPDTDVTPLRLATS